MDLKYLNYAARYKMLGEERKSVCFGSFLGSLQPKITVFLIRDPSLICANANNYCPFNVAEVQEVCDLIQDVTTATPQLRIIKHRFEISFDFTGKTTLQKKLALTLTRLLWEHPMVMFYFDALRLRRMPEFEGVELFNLIRLTSTVRVHRDHFISTWSLPKFVPMETYRHILKNSKDLNLTTVFDSKDVTSKIECQVPAKILPKSCVLDLFNKRLEYYLTIYNKIKDL